MTDRRVRGTLTQTDTRARSRVRTWERVPVHPIWDWLAPLLWLPLGLWGLTGVREAVETDLELRSAVVLAAGAPGLHVEFTGRDAVVSGPRSAGVQEAAVLSTVLGVEGVRVASVELQSAAPAPPPAAPSPTDPSPSAPSPTVPVEPMATKPTPPPAPPPAPVTPPAPPAQVVAKVRACQEDVREVLQAATITFETDSAVITEAGGRVVRDVHRVLAGCAEAKVRVEGHTDADGSEEHNQRLSEARAAAVVSALTRLGVPAASLTSVGRGETRPVADNGSPEGKAKNRRIELFLSATP